VQQAFLFFVRSWKRHQTDIFCSATSFAVIAKLDDPRPRQVHRTADPEVDGDVASNEEDEESDEEGTSLTRRLAETVVSVREMSKQLGMAKDYIIVLSFGFVSGRVTDWILPVDRSC
jgi:hypothetical protein